MTKRKECRIMTLVAITATGVWWFAFFAVLVVVGIFCWGSPRNYAAVDYVDGNIVIYMSSSKNFKRMPFRARSFTISDGSDHWAWAIEEQPGADRNEREYASVVYGEIPSGYREISSQRCEGLCIARRIKPNLEYRISNVWTIDNELVVFKLTPCETAAEELCLETNSPVTDTIRQAHEKRMRR